MVVKQMKARGHDASPSAISKFLQKGGVKYSDKVVRSMIKIYDRVSAANGDHILRDLDSRFQSHCLNTHSGLELVAARCSTNPKLLEWVLRGLTER